MKISDLEFNSEMEANAWKGHSVETNTELHYMVSSTQSAQRYIDQFGDVEIVYDEKYRRWRVPVFAEQIRRFSEAKALDCARWGSE